MKSMKNSWFMLLTVLLILITACSNDENVVDPNGNDPKFESLSSPYLVCANRNPGGVGFDFEYKNEKGGANNLDSLSVTDFTYDILVRTIKAEKPDGNLGGMPYIALAENAEAINYSGIDATCKGKTKFDELKQEDLMSFTLKSDEPGFDVSNLEKGATGKPLMSAVKKEYMKLVIGDKWKASANNDIAEDELIWIIKTSEGRIIKLIVIDFPADPAPTATGYIDIEWDFIN